MALGPAIRNLFGGARRASRTAAPSAEAIARARRMRASRWKNRAKEAGWAAFDLAAIGFGGMSSSDSVFASALTKNAAKGTAAEGRSRSAKGISVGTDALPPFEAAKTVGRKSNPTLSTIVQQLDSIIKVANQIGAITHAQQEELLNQIKQSRSELKEQDLENTVDTASMMSPDATASAESLAPLNSAFGMLIDSVRNLTSIVNEMAASGGTGGAGPAPVAAPTPTSGRRGRRRGPARRYTNRERRALERQGLRHGVDRTGRHYVTDARGRRVSVDAADEAIERQLRITATKQAMFGAGLAAVPLTVALGKSFSSVTAQAVGNRLSAEDKSKVRDAISKPLAAAIGPDKIKEIYIADNKTPDTAVTDILAGKPADAGVDSSMVKPLSAVGALATELAANVAYKAVFNVDPNVDPDFGNRLPLITAAVGDVIRDMLRSRFKSRRSPKATIAPSPSSVAPPPPTPAPVQTSAPPVSSTGTPTSSSSSSSTGSPPVSSETQSAPTATPEQAAAPVPPPASTGAELNASSVQAENEAMYPSFPTGSIGADGLIPPARGPNAITTRDGAIGIGNVRDPNFYDVPMWIIDTTE